MSALLNDGRVRVTGLYSEKIGKTYDATVVLEDDGPVSYTHLNEDKKTAVHFLNQVDEADLMALMEDGNAKEEPPAVCSCTKKCEAGAVNTACPVCVTDKSKCTGKAPEPPAETPAPPYMQSVPV